MWGGRDVRKATSVPTIGRFDNPEAWEHLLEEHESDHHTQQSTQQPVAPPGRWPFTPEVVDERLCVARIWNLGQGGQCRSAALGQAGLCSTHRKQKLLKLGKVTQEPSYDVLQRFYAFRRAQQQARDTVAKPPARRKNRWYTYYHLWRQAELQYGSQLKSGLAVLDLTSNELNHCLQRAHQHLLMNPGSRQDLQKDAGPGGVEDLFAHGEKCEYNGPGGGKFFKWFSPNIFTRELQALRAGADRTTCTEHEAMEALRTTNERLHHRHFTSQHMKPFSGPQCFLQCRCSAPLGTPCGRPDSWPRVRTQRGGRAKAPCANCVRHFANSQECRNELQVASADDIVAEQLDMRHMWFSCDLCCKSRLIAYDSVEALAHAEYHDEGQDFIMEGDQWKRWMSKPEVEGRHSAWLQQDAAIPKDAMEGLAAIFQGAEDLEKVPGDGSDGECASGKASEDCKLQGQCRIAADDVGSGS